MEGDLRSTGHLHGHNSRKLQRNRKKEKTSETTSILGTVRIVRPDRANLVQIGVGEDGELLLDGLEQPHGDVQTRVGAVRLLRRVLHRTEGAAGPRGHVERPRRVPPAQSKRKPRSGHQNLPQRSGSTHADGVR